MLKGKSIKMSSGKNVRIDFYRNKYKQKQTVQNFYGHTTKIDRNS